MNNQFNNFANNIARRNPSQMFNKANANNPLHNMPDMSNIQTNNKNSLLDSLNNDISAIMDYFDPSSKASQGFAYSKMQFSFQQNTMEYMETDTGFQYYQKDISIEISSEKFEAGSLDEDALNQLTDYFSPENTANRISNLATSFFPLYAQQNGLEDNTENRQQYVDFINPSIDKGYQQAIDEIGSMPDEMAAELSKTMDLVHENLNAFASGEPVGYHDKINTLIDEQFTDADENQDGLLSLKETGLSEERFIQLDQDQDGLVSKEEIASLIDELDPTKDLDKDLVLSILNPNESPQEIATKAKSLLDPSNRISMETLSINTVVSKTIIEYSEEQQASQEEDKKADNSFAKYLDKNKDAQDEINKQPDSVKNHLLKYKLDSVMNQLNNFKDSLPDFTEDFFKENNEKLDFLFNNSKMTDFFSKNPESAANFIN